MKKAGRQVDSRKKHKPGTRNSMKSGRRKAYVKAQSHESVCLLQERERSWFSWSKRVKDFHSVCVCVFVYPRYGAEKSSPPCSKLKWSAAFQ